MESKLKKEYTISVRELIDRPIIREDFNEEWMNKMTDDEINQWDKETYAMLKDEGITEYPDVNGAHLSKHIDRSILYELIKQAKNSAIYGE
jgi:hypothetical protein